MTLAESAIEIMDRLKAVRSRTPPISTLGPWWNGSWENYHRAYDKLVDDWIPSQPDADDLMRLFIIFNFDPVPFLCAVMGRFDTYIDLKVKHGEIEP